MDKDALFGRNMGLSRVPSAAPVAPVAVDVPPASLPAAADSTPPTEQPAAAPPQAKVAAPITPEPEAAPVPTPEVDSVPVDPPQAEPPPPTEQTPNAAPPPEAASATATADAESIPAAAPEPNGVRRTVGRKLKYRLDLALSWDTDVFEAMHVHSFARKISAIESPDEQQAAAMQAAEEYQESLTKRLKLTYAAKKGIIPVPQPTEADRQVLAQKILDQARWYSLTPARNEPNAIKSLSDFLNSLVRSHVERVEEQMRKRSHKL